MLDQSGLDTELARLLHRTERVDLAVLRGSLDEVRRARPEDGPTLARILAGRGVLSEAELADLLAQLGPMSSKLTASFEESMFGAPKPERTQVARPRPSSRLVGVPNPSASDLARPPQGSVEGTERAWAPVSGSGERVPAARGGRPSGSWDVRPAGAVSDSAERVVDGWRIGGRIGDYVLESQAGAGAMGVVFIARHVTTGARSAVKTMRSTADAEMLERFQREGEAQAKVDGHSNVARVHTMGEAYGRKFLVMELVEGGNLEQRVKLGLPSFSEAARIAAGIAHGLAHMHSRDVLHRDLKPANVLFDHQGTPKLVDFGLARQAGASRLTVTGEVIGTPAFMAPEQTSGLRDQAGPWTDIWALGGVLFYMLTGRPPFEGRTVIEVLTRVAEEEAATVRSVRADAPQELDALCRRLMCRDVERRPSALEAALALEAFVTKEVAPTMERPPSGAVRGLSAIAALAVVAGGLAVLFVRPGSGDTRSSTAPVSTTASHSVATTGIPARRPVVPPPVAKVPEAPVAVAQAPWVVGQSRRCVVHIEVDGELVQWMQRIEVEILQRLDMTWRVKAVEAGRVVIDATIDQFAINSVGRPPEGAAGGLTWDVAYDSQREGSETSPFQAVLGSTIKLILDPVTGQIIEEEGTEAVQAIVTERATAQVKDDDDRGGRWARGRAVMQYQVPLLAEPDSLRETLNGGLQVFPAGGRPSGRRWTLRREPQLAGSSIWPAGCWADVDMTASGDDTVVSWRGTREATYKPQWAPPKVQGTLERIVEGQATVTPTGRVASAAFKESWRTTFAANTTTVGTRAVYDVKIDLTDLP